MRWRIRPLCNRSIKTVVTFICVGLVCLAHYAAAYAQKAVFLVRHADRQDGSLDSPLSEAGETRAARLAMLFQHAGITGIYTSQWKRTMMTARPLAAALNIEPVIVPGMDIQKLAQQIRSEHPEGIVLIVGHHETIPLLLKSLGSVEDTSMEPSEYDNLFLWLPNGNHAPTLLRLHY